jgi:exopolysaccharide biosynthesis polyprenyl glycosylphosphotransferase
MSIQGQFEQHLMVFFIFALFLIINFYFQNGYKPSEDRRPESEIETVVKGTAFGFLLGFTVNFIVFKETVFSRYVLLTWWLTSMPTLVVLRLALRELYKMLWWKGYLQQRVLLVGAVQGAEWVCQHLAIQGHHGFKYVGILVDASTGPTSLHRFPLPVLGYSADLARVAKTFEIDRVFIGMSAFSYDQVMCLLRQCEGLGLSVNIISEMFNGMHYKLELNEYIGLLTMKFDESPLKRQANRLLKRGGDIILSLSAMPALGLLYLVLGLLIKREDGGPIIYRRKVVGKEGVEFDAFKFRSMTVNAEQILLQNEKLRQEFVKNYKLTNDPRVTKVGSFIRKYSLDEVPQLINVLKGQMSLVGPRMITKPELENFGQYQDKLLTVTPGMTGFWQVRGRQDISYDDRVKMDMFYIDYWSIWMDAYLLIKTVWQVCKAEGAY